MFVYMELIQIHISEPISTELWTRLPLGLEEVVGYVWTHNISTFPPFRRILSGASTDLCAEDGCRRQSPPLLRYPVLVWRHANTSWNRGYKGIVESGRAGSHLVPMILQWPPKKKGPRGRRGQEFRVHTYPTTSSRPREKRVQSLVQIGSEMWICISSI